MEWNDIDEKTKGLGNKSVPGPLCPAQIPRELPWA
jgi:hypothetical protein